MIIILLFIIAFSNACAVAENGYVIDIDLRGLDSIKDDMEGHNIVSFYMPQKVNGEDVSKEGMGMSGSGIYYYDEQIVKIKYYENKIESVYREAIVELLNSDDFKYIFKMREIYRHVSNASDRGDEAANVLGRIIVKLT
jgi:hypothetical protein